jgi:guanylate kinase
MEENVNFDNEVLAYLTIRKDQLIESHKQYIQGHPEIREVLNDFMSAVLLHKPNDVFVFAKEYFHPFNPTPLKYKPLIMVGPSGVGKNTLREFILQEYGGLFEPKVSYTTRPGKSIEKKKENYYFITKEEFMKVSISG